MGACVSVSQAPCVAIVSKLSRPKVQRRLGRCRPVGDEVNRLTRCPRTDTPLHCVRSVLGSATSGDSNMKIRTALGAVVLTATVSPNLVAQFSATDYPQWRGQNRDGAASAFSPSPNWPESLSRRWRIQVGEGYATPIIVGGSMFVFARDGEDEVVISLDAASGAIRWKSGYAAPYVPSKPAAAHGAGPKATPVYHEGRVFTLGISGVVAAFDAATGKLLWRSPAPAEPPYFSAASSPVADGPLVFAHPGNYGPLTAFDTATGAVRWTSGEGGFFASPLIATLSGTRQLVTVTQKSVIGVSVEDGAVLWQFPWAGAAGGPMPVVYGQSVIISGLDQGVAAFSPSRRNGQWVLERRWETKDVSMYLSDPVVIDDTLFGFSHRQSGQYFAIDARTGATLWLGNARQSMNAAVAKAGSLLFLLQDDAQLWVARANRERLEIIRRYTVADSATWAQPVLSGTRLFVRDASAVSLWAVE
jgi:outer membrane protein assembly factor BamB